MNLTVARTSHMTKPLFLIMVVLLVSTTTHGKSKKANLVVDFSENQSAEMQNNLLRNPDGISIFRQGDPGFFLSSSQPIPVTQAFPFLTLAFSADILNYDPSLIDMQVRFSADGSNWNSWKVISRFSEGPHIKDKFVGDLLFVDTVFTFFQYMVVFNNTNQFVTPVKLRNLKLDFFSPGEIVAPPIGPIGQPSGPIIDGGNPSSCKCSLPNFENRLDWNCPDGQTPSCAPPEFTTTTHMIVHHSAGPNFSSDWAATVLSIWNFHVNTNGWCDIGYNWIIDPNGIVYEGRGGGDEVRGAHFCATNSGTMGVCLLGNFQDAPPTPEALESLKKLLAWKSCASNLQPLGMGLHASSSKNLFVISGHRDGCNTLCPGDTFYPMLPSVRNDVHALLQACLGISSIEKELSLRRFEMYPNPASDNLTLTWEQDLSQEGSIRIVNVQGAAVVQQSEHYFPGSTSFQINTQSLPAGIYVVEVQVGESFLRKPLMVRR